MGMDGSQKLVCWLAEDYEEFTKVRLKVIEKHRIITNRFFIKEEALKCSFRAPRLCKNVDQFPEGFST